MHKFYAEESVFLAGNCLRTYIYMNGIMSRISCPMCRQQVGRASSYLSTFHMIKSGLITE